MADWETVPDITKYTLGHLATMTGQKPEVLFEQISAEGVRIKGISEAIHVHESNWELDETSVEGDHDNVSTFCAASCVLFENIIGSNRNKYSLKYKAEEIVDLYFDVDGQRIRIEIPFDTVSELPWGTTPKEYKAIYESTHDVSNLLPSGLLLTIGKQSTRDGTVANERIQTLVYSGEEDDMFEHMTMDSANTLTFIFLASLAKNEIQLEAAVLKKRKTVMLVENNPKGKKIHINDRIVGSVSMDTDMTIASINLNDILTSPRNTIQRIMASNVLHKDNANKASAELELMITPEQIDPQFLRANQITAPQARLFLQDRRYLVESLGQHLNLNMQPESTGKKVRKLLGGES